CSYWGEAALFRGKQNAPIPFIDERHEHSAGLGACTVGMVLLLVLGETCRRTTGGHSWLVHPGAIGLQFGMVDLLLSLLSAHLHSMRITGPKGSFHRCC